MSELNQRKRSSKKKTGSSSSGRRAKDGEIALRSPNDYTREMDRVFSDFERRVERSFRAPFGGALMWPGWRFEFPEIRQASADLIDTGNEYRVHVDVPGIPKERLNISVTAKEIQIDGEAESNIGEKKEGFVRRERRYSRVHRNLVFPFEVVPESAEATVKNGVLEVTVPKKTPAESKTQKVEVK